jgi:hypothetical protein
MKRYHSAVGAYSSMALQQPRNWLKESYTLETSVSTLACFVRQIEPAEKTVHASKQGRDDPAYSGKLETGAMPLRCIPADASG